MGAKVWTGKGGASVADPDNWEHLTTAQFNSVENGGAMVEDLNKQEIKCPQCLRVWPIRSEQAAAVCKHGKCVACLVNDKDEFEPDHMLVVNTRKGVTTRAEAEKAQADAVKDLAGAASVLKAMGKPGTFQQALQDDTPVWTADDDLDACGGGDSQNVSPEKERESEKKAERAGLKKGFDTWVREDLPRINTSGNHYSVIDDVVGNDPDEYQVLYVTPWGDELEAEVVDKVRMHPGYYELLCPAVSEKPFICCKSDIKSARKVTLEPGDRVDIPGDSLSWFEKSLPFWMFVLMASLCSFAAGAAWHLWMESLRG